jgi:hypothetical protein
VLNAENIYYLFSSAAQSVAAFVGLILTGYAFVHSSMDTAAGEDATLQDAYDAIKAGYFKEARLLACAAGGAILTSLAVVYLNARSYSFFPLLAGVATTLTIGSVAGGIRFIVDVIDPAKFRVAAQRIAKQVHAPAPSPGPTATVSSSQVEPASTAVQATAARFFEAYVRVERYVRALWFRAAMFRAAIRAEPPTSPRRYPSMRQMIQLLRGELIPPQLTDRIIRLSQYRNLVFHGHVLEVDPAMVDEAERVYSALQEVSPLPEDAINSAEPEMLDGQWGA